MRLMRRLPSILDEAVEGRVGDRPLKLRQARSKMKQPRTSRPLTPHAGSNQNRYEYDIVVASNKHLPIIQLNVA